MRKLQNYSFDNDFVDNKMKGVFIEIRVLSVIICGIIFFKLNYYPHVST